MLDRRDLSGTTIAGRYRVQRCLGSGGMGAVWLVQHLESLQLYALKTLHAQVANDRLAVERFLREARAAAALRSKHVVKVVDAQMNHVDEKSHELMPFLVMELLEGANLEELIAAQERLSADETIWVLRGVAKALDVAHQKGIVHRDLKPENVFIALDDEGEPVPKVCDFGIAKLAGDAAIGLMSTGALGTQTGITVGTPMYMSPEQARSTTEVGVESDQWAVGLIAFKLLTGREYFSTARSTTELLLKIVNDPLEPPTTRLSTLPPAFDAWFFKSCARDPKERWASAGEQIAALTEVLGVTTPRAPTLPKSDRVIATAETVSVESLAPEARHATTAAPASRTMSEPLTATPVRKTSRAPLLAALAVLAVFAGGGVIMLFARAKPPSVESPVDKPLAVKPTVDKSAAEKPTVAPPPTPATADPPVASASVKPAVTAPHPTAVVTSTAKSGKVAPVPTATATATATTAKPAAQKLPKGAACARSSECASGYCVSEECQ